MVDGKQQQTPTNMLSHTTNFEAKFRKHPDISALCSCDHDRCYVYSYYVRLTFTYHAQKPSRCRATQVSNYGNQHDHETYAKQMPAGCLNMRAHRAERLG